MTSRNKIRQALEILVAVGLPSAQHNDRTAICLLALLDIAPATPWRNVGNPQLGVRAILDFARSKYNHPYAENTRETVRDESIKPMVAAGMLMHNPDQPDRAVNSPKSCYQIDPAALNLCRSFGSKDWQKNLEAYLSLRPTLAARYAMHRELERVPVRMATGLELTLSAGQHSRLIKAIIEDFAAHFLAGGDLIYVGDTGSKWAFFDKALLSSLGVTVPHHGQMPDVVLYHRQKHWLVLVEAVASSGPVDGRRHSELSRLFATSSAGLVFVSAFADRGEMMRKFLSVVAWETEVWCASDPTHLIHFNGSRFLGPYSPITAAPGP